VVNESPVGRVSTARRTGTRQQQVASRRQQIVDAARRLFARHGYHGTAIRDVHREIGASDGLLYHYFPSKLDLLHAVLADGFAAMTGNERLADDLPHDTPVRQALLVCGRLLWSRWTQNNDLMQILVREHRVLEEAGDFSLPAFFLRSSAGLAEFLERRMAAGEMRRLEPMVAARHFLNVILGLYLFQIMLGGDRVLHHDFEDVLRETVDMIWAGWAA
jgi:AcrR family transcriptional regulator